MIVASVRAVRQERDKFGRGNMGDDWRILSWSDEKLFRIRLPSKILKKVSKGDLQRHRLPGLPEESGI